MCFSIDGVYKSQWTSYLKNGIEHYFDGNSFMQIFDGLIYITDEYCILQFNKNRQLLKYWDLEISVHSFTIFDNKCVAIVEGENQVVIYE